MIDSHVHLEMLEDVDGAMARAREAGLKLVVTITDALRDYREVVKIAERFDEVVFGIGVHPHDASRWGKDVEKIIREALRHRKAVMIGETGLDYYRLRSPREVQVDVFRRQLEIATEVDMPVSVHIRDAYDEAYRILSEFQELSGKIILHCYSSDAQDVERYLNLGCYISFAGPVTYPKANKLREAASVVPLDRVLVETDCPYLSPQAVRGKKNEPANVVYVIDEIAKLKGISASRLSKQVYLNLRLLLKLLGSGLEL